MVKPREVVYVDQIVPKGKLLLAADIGGTNSNFGVFITTTQGPLLMRSLHYKSATIDDFTQFIHDMLQYLHGQYGYTITQGCFGAAGIVRPERTSARPTNLTFSINTKQLVEATSLTSLFLINDFEAVALGVELLDPSALVSINPQGKGFAQGNVGFIGAGTGLGKSMLIWHQDAGRYFPVASEGGHADAAFQHEQEYAFCTYLQKVYNACSVSWEMVLSGKGIQHLYRFLGTQQEYAQTPCAQEIEKHEFHPDKISFYAARDPQSRDTFAWYRTFYARACKNFALESLALNGLYIAGGIASKNLSLFQDPQFLKEFLQCSAQSHHLHTMPVYVITDYNVSLYGAYVAAQLRNDGDL